ncbi:MAG TPA: pantoate--beta-alanine ligase [Xanthobacteraceae bacterium]|nr:pantoate--beta-alanine ligase [Xanthobacteraceae bacterium]
MADTKLKRPKVARTRAALARHVGSFREAGESIALVPTMGALHSGHVALVRRARRQADRVIVSIFVNPTQFAPHEDLARYPRTWRADLATLSREDVDLVWAPSVEEMYPPQFATRIAPEGPAVAGLEDKFRPHFFGGVATVVAKLFVQCQPDWAVFGQKDYQQLKVVTRMARDLDLPLRIIGAPTMREKDGLALSSRNAYLSPRERAAAPALYRALSTCAAAIRKGAPLARALNAARKSVRQAGFKLDYLEARNADTLAPVASRRDGPIRLLVAARIGGTRLIDNLQV